MIAYIDAGCSFTANAISLIMYLFTFALIRSSFRKHVSKQAQAIRAAELRLLMAALIPFTVFTLNTILQIMTIAVNNIRDVMFLNTISYPLVDVIYSSQPWGLLITSSAIRESLWMALTSVLPHRLILNTCIFHCIFLLHTFCYSLRINPLLPHGNTAPFIYYFIGNDFPYRRSTIVVIIIKNGSLTLQHRYPTNFINNRKVVIFRKTLTATNILSVIPVTKRQQLSHGFESQYSRPSLLVSD
uniref:G protein-coupled receptor n=1 Tax=Heterorhabditis bacteriophora TaxID=37862 RepID=A0A1I7WLV6_HETBA